MNSFDKKKLLECMAKVAPGGGVAEHESDDEHIFLKNFLPVPNYRMALEVDNFLILGGRGVGKTEFFRLLANSSGRQALVENLKIKGLPPLEKTIWIAGYGRTKTRGKNFPAPDITEDYMKNKDRIDWRIFWIGLILGAIFQQEKKLSNHTWAEEIPEEIRESLTNKLSLLSHWFPYLHQNFENINYALDKLDEELIASDCWLFITYDELDRIVPFYLELAAPIAELLAFWLDRWRRWERIRPKIFLRTDLFQQEFLGFPDASKLRGHQISLEWKTSWLYQVLVKRLANSGEEMNDYLQIVPGLIPSKKDKILGILPASDESRFELLMEKIVGEYMGNNPRKGYTYNWIPNHLQDAKRSIAPRSFLKLFSLAAERRLEKFEEKKLSENRLLEPSDLQGALMDTSQDRIKELTEEEYPWLEALKIGLKNLNLLTKEENFIDILKNTKWNKEPPTKKPQEILKYLEQLGIVEIRSDRRINMPDIYRYGFEVKRKGGIKRPK